jgi:N-acetylglutamate synthase
MSLTRADVGHRVVVRRLLPGERGPTGGPAMTDVIGMLESWVDDVLVVCRADGERVTIRTAVIVSGKRVPAAPTRRGRPGAEA